jgi:hypothetical protein
VRHVEHEHQVALVAWANAVKLPAADDVAPGSTVGDLLLAIPMGGKRNPREAARLKAEGAKAGVSDLLLPLRRQGFGSFWLEMKAPGEKPSAKQRAWLEAMRLAGHRAEWFDDWTRAAEAIQNYLGLRC